MFTVPNFVCLTGMPPLASMYSPFSYNSCPAYRAPVCLPGFRPLPNISCKTATPEQTSFEPEKKSSQRNPFSIEAILTGGNRPGMTTNDLLPKKGASKYNARFNPVHCDGEKINTNCTAQEARETFDQVEEVMRRYSLKIDSPHRINDPSQHWTIPATTSHKPAKRVRTIFTSEQLQRLENEFKKQQYMVGAERVVLAAELHLSEAQVKVWFQNRRIKWRKESHERDQAKLAEYRTRRDEIRRKLGLSPRRTMTPGDIKAKRLLDSSNDVIASQSLEYSSNEDTKTLPESYSDV